MRRLAGTLGLTLFAMPCYAQTCQSTIADTELVQPGTLTMATNPTLRPLQFVDSAGELRGMRIELGYAIAKRLCLKPRYIRIEFSAMIPGLELGRWDMINTGIFWTPQRAATMQMIKYESQAISISVPRGNPLGIATPEDLAGRSVGVEIGGFEESRLRQLNQSLIEDKRAPINIRTFDNFSAAFQALSAGQTDATISIDPTAAEYARRGGVDRVASGLYPTPVALAMKSPVLSAAVVNVLNDMQSDGSFQQLMDRYGLAAETGLFSVSGPQQSISGGWNWRGFFDYLANGYLLMGAITTLWLTLASMCGGLILGSVLAWGRMAQHQWIAIPARIYLWMFRGTPLLVQLIVIYTGLPQIGIKFSVLESALIGLILNEAAYLAEIIRGGVIAVPAGQRNAGRALGLNSVQVMRHIVIPQAIRIIIPAIGNSVNGMLKTTAITSVISMEELLRRTQLLIQDHFMVLELFTVASIYYLVMTSAWSLVQHRIEIRFGRADRTLVTNNVH